PVAPIVEPDLAVQARDLRVRELDVVAAPRADPDHRGFDIAHEPRVGASHDLDATPAEPRGGRTSSDVRDPGPRAQVIDRHVSRTVPQAVGLRGICYASAGASDAPRPDRGNTPTEIDSESSRHTAMCHQRAGM